jgi:5-methyltetrahydrofolate--homocysteine methyltransferase
MKRTGTGTPFLIIGENIHATRTLARTGRHVVTDGAGELSIAFTDPWGTPANLPLAAPVAAGSEAAAGRIKHVRNALLLGIAAAGIADPELAGPPSDEAAAIAVAYLAHLAARQVAAGADYLDVNVDEVGGDVGLRVATMEWVVRTLEAAPEVSVPLSLDSSSAAVLAAGLAASARPHGPLLLNSASLERLDVLDLGAAAGCPLVLGAAGESTLPSSAAERVANAERILAAATDRGVALADIHLDPLVMPAGVDPEAGVAFLEAARSVRARYGPDLHLTGGLSNVSFGLPGRRLLNDVFLVLASDAGVDSGIIDPVSADFDRVFGLDRESEPFRLAADLLEGRDAYGMDYLRSFRTGSLAGSLA